MKKLNYATYVLRSLKDGDFYIGYSENLKQRLTDHFCGHVKSTASRRPLELVFCEYFVDKKDAMRREKYFKTSPGKKGLKLMLREFLKQNKFQ